MLISYSSLDEILICPQVRESEMLASWFAEGTGRDADDYDREVSPSGIIVIRSLLRVDSD